MILPILHYPDKRLRIIAKEVKTVDKSIKILIKNMFATMYSASGIGLAAVQVNCHKRIIVIDISEDTNKPLCLINPVIVEKSEELTTPEYAEGCLSIPDYRANVKRSQRIKVKALDKNGEDFVLKADGLLSICIQHETDHLNGILFVDYLSKLKQQRLLDKIKKLSVVA